MKVYDILISFLGIASLSFILYILGINIGTFILIILLSFLSIYAIYVIIINLGHIAPNSFYIYFHKTSKEEGNASIYELSVVSKQISEVITTNKYSEKVIFNQKTVHENSQNILNVIDEQIEKIILKHVVS